MKFPIFAALALLAACAAPGPETPPAGAPQPGDLLGGATADVLVEREPDLCQAEQYQRLVGQPGSVVPGIGITREYRVVEFGAIVTQEYNAGRLNFRLDPAGTIVRVDCG